MLCCLIKERNIYKKYTTAHNPYTIFSGQTEIVRYIQCTLHFPNLVQETLRKWDKENVSFYRALNGGDTYVPLTFLSYEYFTGKHYTGNTCQKFHTAF